MASFNVNELIQENEQLRKEREILIESEKKMFDKWHEVKEENQKLKQKTWYLIHEENLNLRYENERLMLDKFFMVDHETYCKVCEDHEILKVKHQNLKKLINDLCVKYSEAHK